MDVLSDHDQTTAEWEHGPRIGSIGVRFGRNPDDAIAGQNAASWSHTTSTKVHDAPLNFVKTTVLIVSPQFRPFTGHPPLAQS